MPIIVIWVLLLAWLITHGIYRGAVGTYCAVKRIEPPWVANRQEKLTNREIRRADRRAVLDSKRTARGFLARLWGDGWEFANRFVDGLGDSDAGDLNAPDAPAPEPIVPADAGESWVRNLGSKATAGWDWARQTWDKWMSPSTNKCMWAYPAGNRCGKKAWAAQRYCREHRRDADRGHCLWGDDNPDVPTCMSHREDDYPFCPGHMDEWEDNGKRLDAAAAAGSPIGDLDTPDAPTLDSAPLTAAATPFGEDPPLPTRQPVDYGCPWKLSDPGRPCNQTVPAGNKFCPEHQAMIGHSWGTVRVCWWGRSASPDSPHHGQPPCGEMAVNDSDYCRRHRDQGAAAPTPAAFNPYGAPAAAPAAAAPPVESDEDRERRLAIAEAERPHCPGIITASGAVCGMPMHKTLDGWVCTMTHLSQDPEGGQPQPGVESDATPRRPELRIVPNTNTQGGDTSRMSMPVPFDKPYVAPPRRVDDVYRNQQGDTTMSAPTQQSTGEATNTQKAKEFAEGVIKSGNEDWPKSVEAAKQQMGTVKLTNDPAIVMSLGAIDEAAKVLAAAGQQLLTAIEGHDGATEQVSSLGSNAADTQAYQNQ